MADIATLYRRILPRRGPDSNRDARNRIGLSCPRWIFAESSSSNAAIRVRAVDSFNHCSGDFRAQSILAHARIRYDRAAIVLQPPVGVAELIGDHWATAATRVADLEQLRGDPPSTNA